MDLREQLQRTLGDAYTLERELGGAGMSRVFVATEKSLGRQVVVKVLPTEMAGQVSAERFKREIAVAAKLQHPHIVPLLTAGDSDGLPFFTMPFVKGESLRAWIARHGELPVGDAIRTLREVASALAFAHDAGVVHRDIKPDNILLSGGAAMVTDFGVAKALSVSTTAAADAITSLGVALGTPAYMSPEQASADPLVDHRADIYAWGITAYELLTGSTPFAGRPAAAMLAAHTTEAVEPVSKRRPALPAPLAVLVMRCLAKRAADRPQRADEIVHVLDAITTPSGTQPTGAFEAAPVSKTPSRARRARLLGGTTAAAAAVAAAAVVATKVISGRGDGAQRSIAVLPFENVGSDSTFDYLAEGLSDEVRSQLTETPGLRVKARASSLVFRGRTVDLRDAGAKLDVSEALVGTIRGDRERLHVTTELVRIADGSAVWSHAFDVASSSSSTVRDSIARAIIDALKLRLAAAESPSGRRPVDAAAYDLFLRGEYHRRRFDLRTAIAYLERAVAKDPSFARAQASLGATYAFLPFDGLSSPDSVRGLANAHIDRAMAIDPNSAVVQFARGMVLSSEFRYREAADAFRRGIALQPGNSEARMQLGMTLALVGRIDEGMDEVRKARDLDPLSTDVLISMQYLLYATRRFREAVDATRPIVALDPNSTFGYLNMGIAYTFLGQRDSAVAAVERALRIDPGSFGNRSWAMFVFAAAGRWALVDEQRRSAQREGGNSPDYTLAFADIANGNLDSAVAAMERGIRGRQPLFGNVFYSCDPFFDPIKSHPRYRALMADIGATICPSAGQWPVSPRPR